MEQITATPSSTALSHCEAVSATELRGALSVALVKAHESGLAWLRLLRLAFFPLSCGVQHTAHAIAWHSMESPGHQTVFASLT